MHSALTQALDDWTRRCGLRAIVNHDHEAIAASVVLRSLIVDLLATDPFARDLAHACARLGAMLAAHQASASLAAAIIGCGSSALFDSGLRVPESAIALAASAVVESFDCASRAAEQTRGLQSWSYPGCAVRLTATIVALSASYPDDDSESLVEWAEGVARGVHHDGYRHAIVAGCNEKAVRELRDALTIFAVETHDRLPPHLPIAESLRGIRRRRK